MLFLMGSQRPHRGDSPCYDRPIHRGHVDIEATFDEELLCEEHVRDGVCLRNHTTERGELLLTHAMEYRQL